MRVGFVDASCGAPGAGRQPALPYVKLSAVAAELVSGAEIGRRLGVTREAVRQWRARPGFPEPLGRVGQALVWDWVKVRKWADARAAAVPEPRKPSHG